MSLAVTIEYHEALTLEERAEMMRTVVLSPDFEAEPSYLVGDLRAVSLESSIDLGDALRWPDVDAECFEWRAVQPSDVSRYP